jgi:hypothetical protein
MPNMVVIDASHPRSEQRADRPPERDRVIEPHLAPRQSQPAAVAPQEIAPLADMEPAFRQGRPAAVDEEIGMGRQFSAPLPYQASRLGTNRRMNELGWSHAGSSIPTPTNHRNNRSNATRSISCRSERTK